MIFSEAAAIMRDCAPYLLTGETEGPHAYLFQLGKDISPSQEVRTNITISRLDLEAANFPVDLVKHWRDEAMAALDRYVSSLEPAPTWDQQAWAD